jgi:hypothetical protein
MRTQRPQPRRSNRAALSRWAQGVVSYASCSNRRVKLVGLLAFMLSLPLHPLRMTAGIVRNGRCAHRRQSAYRGAHPGSPAPTGRAAPLQLLVDEPQIGRLRRVDDRLRPPGSGSRDHALTQRELPGQYYLLRAHAVVTTDLGEHRERSPTSCAAPPVPSSGLQGRTLCRVRRRSPARPRCSRTSASTRSAR